MKRLPPLLATAGLIATTLSQLAVPQASAAPSTPEYMNQKPSWHRCSADKPTTYECAALKVPLDYKRPQGPTIDLAISRVKSENPAKRHGVLLLNPGGPGASGLYRPMRMSTEMPKDVRDRYDLIGFDPRGVGASSPVTCGLNQTETGIGGAYRPERFASDVAWARSVADKCREKAGDVLPYITTRNTARDLDVIRAALGERKISYLGYSYGTYLGAVYSQMFPQRTDRFVLDSGVDPHRIWRGMYQVWATSSGPAFERWTHWAAERSAEYGLGATPEAVSGTFWALVARADREPIDYFGQKVTGDEIRDPGVFYSPVEASIITRSLKAAAERTPLPADAGVPDVKRLIAGSGVAAGSDADTEAAPAPGSGPARAAAPGDNATAVYWSVVCGDTENWPRDPAQYARDAVQDKVKYPLYGDFSSNIKPCAFWQPPLEAATPMTQRARVLTVQNEWDPMTPLSSGQGLHRALKGSRMVLAKGGQGHGVYLSDPTSCANDLVDTYLTTGRLPARDVTCQSPPRDQDPQGSPAP
ncbi:alpha/beta hydrolase [Streptomyces xanthophaeus]|uniref:alpha/beta hydrolase n=1 Tax=Streptomyces xanthophaeus TaxID=67385 RepID=UPI0004CD81D2|nr:alpha/beta hydrolase [Streptomyces xanthophaeus]